MSGGSDQTTGGADTCADASHRARATSSETSSPPSELAESGHGRFREALAPPPRSLSGSLRAHGSAPPSSTRARRTGRIGAHGASGGVEIRIFRPVTFDFGVSGGGVEGGFGRRRRAALREGGEGGGGGGGGVGEMPRSCGVMNGAAPACAPPPSASAASAARASSSRMRSEQGAVVEPGDPNGSWAPSAPPMRDEARRGPSFDAAACPRVFWHTVAGTLRVVGSLTGVLHAAALLGSGSMGETIGAGDTRCGGVRGSTGTAEAAWRDPYRLGSVAAAAPASGW